MRADEVVGDRAPQWADKETNVLFWMFYLQTFVYILNPYE